jgi:transposase
MFFVGIDIAKNSHEACVIDLSGKVVVKPLQFQNSVKGFTKLTNALFEVSSNISDFEIGMEATGHYWINLYCKLIELDFNVHVINPVQSDALRNLYIRKTKNDSKDSFIIADLIRFGRYSETSLSNPELLTLKELSRQRLYLVDCISDAKRKVIGLLDKIFPEYSSLFTDTFGATSLQLLSTYTSPDELASVDTNKLTEFLSSASNGRFAKSKANEIKTIAKNSFGSALFSQSSSFAIKQFIEQIKLLESQVNDLDNFIAELLPKFNTNLTTIPGVGTTLAATIVSEIGDINRFDSPEKLVAFAGIDPSVKQSGEFNGSQNHMSKRGSPYLRRALWLAAVAANLHNPALHALYEKKRSQGKPYTVAISALQKKLVNIIFYLLKTGEEYHIVMPSDN